MRLDDRMLKFLVGLLALSSGLQSCMSNAEDCEQNGSCPRYTTGAGGAGGVGSDGVTTTSTACSSHPECGSCAGGVLQATAAGTLCGDDQVCNGDGDCVACHDTDHPCPSGYDCNGGKCGLAKGASCNEDAQCASGFCVGGHCCANECAGACRTCDSTTDFTCELTPMYSGHDPTCVDTGYACDGGGNCKGQNNTACTENADCISNYCNTTNDRCQQP